MYKTLETAPTPPNGKVMKNIHFIRTYSLTVLCPTGVSKDILCIQELGPGDSRKWKWKSVISYTNLLFAAQWISRYGSNNNKSSIFLSWQYNGRKGERGSWPGLKSFLMCKNFHIIHYAGLGLWDLLGWPRRYCVDPLLPDASSHLDEQMDAGDLLASGRCLIPTLIIWAFL